MTTSALSAVAADTFTLGGELTVTRLGNSTMQVTGRAVTVALDDERVARLDELG